MAFKMNKGSFELIEAGIFGYEIVDHSTGLRMPLLELDLDYVIELCMAAKAAIEAAQAERNGDG